MHSYFSIFISGLSSISDMEVNQQATYHSSHVRHKLALSSVSPKCLLVHLAHFLLSYCDSKFYELGLSSILVSFWILHKGKIRFYTLKGYRNYLFNDPNLGG